MNRAVVVEQSRASYLIGILGMLKIEGSNPGGGIFFANFENYMNVRGQELQKSQEFHATSPLAGSNHVQLTHDCLGGLRQLNSLPSY